MPHQRPTDHTAPEAFATRVSAERVLVVDDDARHLKLVRLLLATDGYDLVACMDAEAALCALEDRVPALILADVDLPGIDGLTFTRRVRNDPRTHRVPIVVVSARESPQDRAKALAAGAALVVSKPLDPEHFPKLVASIVRPSAATGAGPR